MNDRIEAILKTLPDHPGVYLMKDKDGEIIYVGKAISLKNRVRQYFHSHKNHSSKVIAMVRKIEDIQYILVDSEMEALILECNLIKKYRPHYNILMKDDKQYPYMRIDFSDPFARVEVVRKVENDGAKYYGPFLSAVALTDVLDAVAKNFPLRTCKKDIAKARARHERPCLNYQIGRCSAPCAGKISEEEYGVLLEQVSSFLQGKYETLLKELKAEMEKCAERMEYEQAAIWRDRIRNVERVIQRQKAAETNLSERDVLAIKRLEGDVMVQCFGVRDGKLSQSRQFLWEDVDQETDAEILLAFVKQYYERQTHIPREILLPFTLEEQELVQQYLSGLRGHKVQLLVPQRGEKKHLVELAEQNAAEGLEKRKLRREHQYMRHEGAVKLLAEELGLSRMPHRMECFDISHTQGVDNVASMVVCIDGKPARKEYRRFKTKTVEGADDFKSMNEVVKRRLLRSMEPDEVSQKAFGNLPDLMVIDGGRGQLNAALRAMDEVGLHIPTIGLAKQLEEVYVPERDETVMLDRKSPALHVLQRIRDEAHRFAVTYHRSLRASHELTSALDEIPGIGPKRRRQLLMQYKTIDQIKQASLEELLAVEGMNHASAEAVYTWAHKDGQTTDGHSIMNKNAAQQAQR